MTQYCGYHFDRDNDGNELLVRSYRIDEYTLGGECFMSKEEFVACYNRWIKGSEE